MCWCVFVCIWIKAGLVPISIPPSFSMTTSKSSLAVGTKCNKILVPTANTPERKICKLWLPNFERPTLMHRTLHQVRRRRNVAKRVGVRGAALRPSKRDISFFLNKFSSWSPSNAQSSIRSTSLHAVSNSLFSFSWTPQQWNWTIAEWQPSSNCINYWDAIENTIPFKASCQLKRPQTQQQHNCWAIFFLSLQRLMKVSITTDLETTEYLLTTMKEQ